jgi:hypothetical protein
LVLGNRQKEGGNEAENYNKFQLEEKDYLED